MPQTPAQKLIAEFFAGARFEITGTGNLDSDDVGPVRLLQEHGPNNVKAWTGEFGYWNIDVNTFEVADRHINADYTIRMRRI